jgi:hypothetical protein
MTDEQIKKQPFIWKGLLLYCLQIYVSAILQMVVAGKKDLPG